MKPRRHHLSRRFLRQHALHLSVICTLTTTIFVNAGDILRGGATGAPTPGTSSGLNTPPPVTPNAGATHDNLARTTQVIQSMRAMQTAARNLAQTSGATNLGQNPHNPSQVLPDVPDGLATGGLKVDPRVPTTPSLWSGAGAPAQTTNTGGKVEVTITQTAQQAILNWQTFNVGKDTTLKFDQSAGGANVGQWVAFNKVNDPTANPTQILGSITAPGQVYIINRNGIIFGGSSQVNARGLTVSSLPINENLIQRGLLNNPDAQFLFSGLAIPAGTNGTPAFTPDELYAADGKYGDVIVQKGAILSSPTDSAKVGGHITLVGANVSNQGSILTPDGQTILAAGLQASFAGHSTSDPSLRGLDVVVGAVTDPIAGLYSGTINQGGVIESPRGSITIAGRSINQSGALASTTSVSLNGRIDLQAQYNAISNLAPGAQGLPFLFQNTGEINLETGSVMNILPEYDSKETTIGTELALRSQVNMVGKTIRLGNESTLIAPNALVNISAGTWLFENSAPPRSTFLQSGGQVYFEQGSVVDVAGSLAVPVSVSQNIISVNLRSAELADSPLQRLGTLRNTTVEVDIRKKGDGWIGTPLANVSGFANLIQRSVGQLTVAGGSVNISAGDSVVMQAGSNVVVSGGSTQFEGGLVRTSKVITGGRLVDIASASPAVIYDGIYDGSFTVKNAKFGVSNVFDGILAPAGYRYEAGYTDGAAGGKLSITAPSMALDGRFTGTTVVGANQRLTPPAQSTLNLSFKAQDISYITYPIYSPSPPTITFDPTVRLAAAEPFALNTNGDPLGLREDRKNLVALSTNLLATDGFGLLTADNHDGTIIVPTGITLAAPTGGSISFNASNITVNGAVTARGGSLSFSTFGITYDEINFLKFNPAVAAPSVQSGRGEFTLGNTGMLTVSGLVVDDRLNQESPLVSQVSLKGGTIKIEGYSANLVEGGIVDVSGGALLNARGGISYGNAGSINILAGRELGFDSTLGGKLSLGADLRGLSGARAGNLAITAPPIQIGGGNDDPNVILLNPDFFSKGGFGTISLVGIGLASSVSETFIPGLRIAENTEIRPEVKAWLGGLDENDIFGLSQITPEEGIRSPVNLTFSAIGATFNGPLLARGDVVTGQGSIIKTDGMGSVTFGGQTITLRGNVIAPGGSISVKGSTSFPRDASQFAILALPNVHIGANALLSTKGKELLVSNPYGLRQGRVLAGGSINISGNLVAEAGAVLDVSGATGILDLPPSNLSLLPSVSNSVNGKRYVQTVIESNGGIISLSGNEMLFSDATLIGRAGGVSATGGLLNISSNRFVQTSTPFTTADTNLIVSQHGIALPASNTALGVGIPVLDVAGNVAPQLGNFSVDRFANGGFDSLSLGGNVRFEGPVSIEVPGSLKVADGGVMYGNDLISLSAANVVLGQAFKAPSLQSPILFNQSDGLNISRYSLEPTYGNGILTVNAKLIDIGDLSLQGIGNAAFLARSGDIRGNGTLQIAGDLTFEAGQIYPPSAQQFNVFAYDYISADTAHKGSVTIRPGEIRSLPLSAGGALSIYASQINQGGVLRAPIGTINLGWDGNGKAPFNPIVGTNLASPVTSLLTLASGSVTSVSTIDPITGKATIIPYGISRDGKSWIDPVGRDITVSGPPEKSLNLAAVNLVTEVGSSVDIRGGGRSLCIPLDSR